MFIWCALTILISFDISLDFAMKREKKVYLFTSKRKKGKKSDMHPPGVQTERGGGGEGV